MLTKKQDTCMDLISEFVFMEKKSQDSRKQYGGGQTNISSLTLIQEFQLVVVLSEFFSRPGPEVSKNAVFLSLFGSVTPYVARSRVLVKLISTAVSGSIIAVLQQKAGFVWL